jgi:hypothetical protein
MLRLYVVFLARAEIIVTCKSADAACNCLQLAVYKFIEFFKACKHFRGAAQQPAADVLHRYRANQINGNTHAVSEGQFTLRAGAASGVLVPIADNRVTAMLDQIKIVGDDFSDRLLKAVEVAYLPGAKLAGFNGGQVFHLVVGGIVNLMSQGLEHRSDLGAPALAEIRRVFNGACEVEKHERRLSAIRGCRSTQI